MKRVAHVSVAGDGRILTVHCPDGDAGWVLHQTLQLSGAIMPLAYSPDGTRLYAARRSAPLAILTMAVAADGTLALLGETPLSCNAVHIATSPCGRWLYAASYDGHVVCTVAIDAQGLAHAETGRLATPPRAHACLPSRDGQTLWVSVLGADCVLALDARHPHALRPTGRLEGRPGSGPRHLAWHPHAPLVFLLNECDATLDVWLVAAGQVRQRLASASLMPAGSTGAPWAADLGLSPDGRTVWVSERRSATVSAWHWDATNQRLNPQGWHPVDANPRSLAVAVDGSGVCVLSQATGMLGWLPADAGKPTTVAPLHCGSNPTWVSCWPGLSR
jgi:6-phosphogluconolactonase